MEFDSGRRRFLEIAGTGTAASLAGCGALQGENNQQTSPTGAADDTAASGDGERQRVAVSTPADQEALRQRQQEIQSALSSGNISQTEAQQRYRTAQEELRTDAISTFRERAAEASGLEIVDAVEQYGVLLVAGTPSALIGTLSFEPVNALLPAATFQQAQTQAQQQGQGAGNATGSAASN